MKKYNFLLLSFIATAFFLAGSIRVVQAVSSPLQISPFHGNGNSPCNVFYTSQSYQFTYNGNGGKVWLSGKSDGNGEIYTDDKIDIVITHADTTTSTFTKNYGNGQGIVPTAAQDITSYFRVGVNTVKVTMTDLAGPYCNSSEYWLFETTGGPPPPPAKPPILARSTWHGDGLGGTIGSYLRELRLATTLNPLIAIGTRFNALFTLSTYDPNYSSIRNTWEGQILLDWLDHKYLKPYGGDIAYHYLVAPDGKIYEGRYKGNQSDTPDNRGSSVWRANTGLIGIAILGKYGKDPKESDTAVSVLDGGIMQPTDASIKSVKNLVDWLAGKYGIDRTGLTTLPPDVNGEISCVRTPAFCAVNNISGHREYDYPTNNESDSPNDTACPGDNVQNYMSTFRGQNMLAGSGVTPSHKIPVGLLIGGFSPVNLGVVDPNGRRLGVDPSTGQFITNIPNGVQGNIILGDAPDEHSFALHVPAPVSGVYKIDVVGTGTGSFTLASEDLQSSNAVAYRGSTVLGQKDNYQVIYSTTNPSNIEMFHDTVPPVTTGTMTCSRDMNGTCRSAATVKRTATDTGTNGDKGSGVGKIECSYDNQVTWQQCGDANGATITISNNGKTSFWYRSIDRVLNVETAKNTGTIDVQRFLAIGDTAFSSNMGTTLQTTGIIHSNGTMSFVYNTTLRLDVLTYKGLFTSTGNTTFTYNQKTQVTQTNPLPSYPLSYYKSLCPNYTGPITITDTWPTYNKCMYVLGDVTFRSTMPSGKLTVVSEGKITDTSTTSTLQPWDTKNGILYYAAKGFSATANGGNYTGVIYAPTSSVNAGFSNATFNGSIYGLTVGFGAGTSLTAYQAAGFPPTTYNLPL